MSAGVELSRHEWSQNKSCPSLYAVPLSTTSDTMDARMDSIDSATDTRGSDEPFIKKRKGEDGEKRD